MPAFAAEEGAQDQRRRSNQFRRTPSEIIANAVPLRWVETQPKQHGAKASPVRPADQRHHRQGKRKICWRPMMLMA